MAVSELNDVCVCIISALADVTEAKEPGFWIFGF
jgi:hypothetical protein